MSDKTELGTKWSDERSELEEYQEWVKSTTSENGKDIRWAVLGLAAEAGEVAGVVEKSIRKGETFAIEAQYEDFRQKLLDEMGDVLWFAAAACNILNVTLDEVIEHNIQKINERVYGQHKS